MERRCFRHEIDFREYSGSTGTIADIVISAGGLGSTDAKMSVSINSTDAVYYSRGLDWSYYEPEILVRVHIDPNTITMASGDAFTFLSIRSGANQLLFLNLRYDGASYEIGGGCYIDSLAVQNLTYQNITDAEHVVEVYLLRATTAGANDGEYTLRIDGTDKETLSTLDCYDVFNAMSAIWVGAVSGIDAGTSGTFYLDEISLRDDDLWPGDYNVPAGTIYYVKNGGNDALAGTSDANAWETLTKIYNEFLAGTFKAGDQILFKAGGTFAASNTAHLRVRNANGTRINQPITISRYGAGADPIMDCTAMAGNAFVYGWWAVDFVKVDSLVITDVPFAVSLQNGARGWIFEGLTIDTNASYGIQLYKSDWCQILNSEISTITEGVYLGLATEVANSTQAIVYNNTIHDTGADGVDLKQESMGCIVRGNTLYNVDEAAVAVFGNAAIDVRGRYHVIRENYLYDIGNAVNTGLTYVGGIIVEDNDTVGLRAEFNRIRNIIRHATVPGFGIKVMGDGQHRILNNSLYDVEDDGIVVGDDAGSTASILRNNIIHTATDGLQIQNSVLPNSNYNIFRSTTNNTKVFGTNRTIAQACSTNGIECNSLTSDPAFTSLVTLTIDATSPAFESGSTAYTNIQLFTDALSRGWHQPNESLPYCILKDGFESIDFSLWTSAVTDGGNLSVSSSARRGTK